MNKSGLDEMQVQRRNKIGNQSFMLLFYLLMLDIGLSGYGFKWMSYPMNVFVIMLVCMTQYLVRILWNNAYVGPQNNTKLASKKPVFLIAIIAFLTSVAILLTQQDFLKSHTTDTNDYGALILFIFSIVALVIAFSVGFIRKNQNSDK